VDRSARIAPRDATVRITLQHMIKRASKSGREMDDKSLATALALALGDPRAPRQIRPKRAVVKAKVRTKDLANRYGTVVTISQSSFRLRLFKRLKFVKSYGVAVGQPAYPTPRGLFSIANKAVNPPWTAPNSPWAGAYRNETVAGGSAENPLKARWMGIVNGVGIHGTGEPGSIGSRASHGCIRMTVPDVIDLYPRVPVGTPVLIR
jgi:lipoprotein-anchoring transpeptidase ErfK/SrfK